MEGEKKRMASLVYRQFRIFINESAPLKISYFIHTKKTFKKIYIQIYKFGYK